MYHSLAEPESETYVEIARYLTLSLSSVKILFWLSVVYGLASAAARFRETKAQARRQFQFQP